MECHWFKLGLIAFIVYLYLIYNAASKNDLQTNGLDTKLKLRNETKFDCFARIKQIGC